MTLLPSPPDPVALWSLGRRTLEQLESPFGFDASERDTGRYGRLFGRDSLWMLLFLAEALRWNPSPSFGEWMERAGWTILSSLAERQGTKVLDLVEEQPGKILHEYHDGSAGLPPEGLPLDEGRSYSGFDQTFLFVTAYRTLVDLFPADPGVEALWPNVERAVEWIERTADDDGDGLFEYRRRHRANLLNQVWKDSFDATTHAGFDVPAEPLAWIEVQAYAHRALLDAADLFERRGRLDRSATLVRNAKRLARQVDALFWLNGEGCYAMALDGQKRPVAQVGSNAGQALWGRVVPASRRQALVRRMLRPDLFTAFGLRTLSAASRHYAPFAYHRGNVWPFDNAVFAAGLLEHGFETEARAVMERVGAAILLFGSTVEVYVVLDGDAFVSPSPGNAEQHLLSKYRVPENRSQGWTAAAAVFFGAALAGLAGTELPDD
jgi:glycogen debranching enzyme